MNPRGYYVDWNAFAFGHLLEGILVVLFFFQEIRHYSWHLKSNIKNNKIREFPNDIVNVIVGVLSIVMVLRFAESSQAKSAVMNMRKNVKMLERKQFLKKNISFTLMANKIDQENS